MFVASGMPCWHGAVTALPARCKPVSPESSVVRPKPTMVVGVPNGRAAVVLIGDGAIPSTAAPSVSSARSPRTPNRYAGSTVTASMLKTPPFWRNSAKDAGSVSRPSQWRQVSASSGHTQCAAVSAVRHPISVAVHSVASVSGCPPISVTSSAAVVGNPAVVTPLTMRGRMRSAPPGGGHGGAQGGEQDREWRCAAAA